MPDMDAEHDRELEAALLARSAAVAPPGFTDAVLRRVGREGFPQALPVPGWLAALSGCCDPVVAGIMLVVVGASLAVDVRGGVMWLGNGLAAPNPLIVTAMVCLISGLWFTTRTELN